LQPAKAPKKRELEDARRTLIKQIDDAIRLLGASEDCPELLTMKAAVNCIEELIEARKKGRHSRAA
jgi:hypothetical protein